MPKTSKPFIRNTKYETTGETRDWFGRTLHQIRAVAEIAALGISVGQLGGWIENESNLQVSGNAWVSGNAQVSGNARVSGNAQVSPIFIQGLRWPVTIADSQMVIGCQSHDLTRWWKFTDKQIGAMDADALAFWGAHKGLLQAICAANGREG